MSSDDDGMLVTGTVKLFVIMHIGDFARHPEGHPAGSGADENGWDKSAGTDEFPLEHDRFVSCTCPGDGPL